MSEITEMSLRQLAAARALAGIGAAELAETANIPAGALSRLEAGAGTSVSSRDFAAVRAALEAAGVEFLADDSGGVGVRLKKAWPEPHSLEGSDLNASNDE